jgi:hypothetical protein
MVGNTENWYGQMTGSNAPQFAHMLPAYAMHGMDLMQGRGTGWDQYAALAGAAPPPDPSKQAAANASDYAVQRVKSSGGGGSL